MLPFMYKAALKTVIFTFKTQLNVDISSHKTYGLSFGAEIIFIENERYTGSHFAALKFTHVVSVPWDVSQAHIQNLLSFQE